MMRRFFLSALAVLMGTGDALAEPSDGVWSARIMPEGSCSYGGELTLNLADNLISGAMEDPDGTSSIQGFLNAGIGSIRMGNSVGLARFTGDKFSLDYRSPCGLRHVDGVLVPKPPAASSYAEQKKAAEARYTELVAKAAGGDLSTDFRAMRFAYPFTSSFDPAITTPDASRALVAFESGDCADALAKSEVALKLDFTNPHIHAMRSACFNRMGNAAQAALENSLERALVDSLRKGADGKTRETAYVVGSYREEGFVMEAAELKDGEAVLSLWGPDHRHYDLVRATSRATGERRIVWFDSELMVEGMAQFLAVPSP